MSRSSTLLSGAAVLSLGIMVLAPSMASAQPAAPAAATVTVNPPASGGIPMFARQLAGKNVWITADGARLRGVVTSVSDTSLVVLENGAPTTIQYDKIVRVEKSTHRLRNGTLIGLASGAGLGFAMMAGLCGDEYCGPGDWVAVPLFYGGLGAAAGVGIGAMVHVARRGGDVLYDVRRHTTTMSLAPILSPTRQGMAFSMTWR
jgi:hypothetical protein